MHIREGIVTGCDNVFIIDERDVPKGEECLFIPFLPDKLMLQYNTPNRTNKRVFYPFLTGKKITSSQLEECFPKTYAYLYKNREVLENRGSVIRGNLIWWQPESLRNPENLLSPKIIAPHLMLLPKFSIDETGKYAISRSPFIYLKKESDEELLYFFLAILNSSICHWYIKTHSHKYSHGYIMLEPKTLRTVPMPDLRTIPAGTLRELIILMKQHLHQPSIINEKRIEEIVFEAYGISKQERSFLNLDA